MEESQTQSVEFNVKLPKPSPRGAIAKGLIGLGALALAGVIAAVVIGCTAAPTPPPVDPILSVLPADTMLVASINTQADQLPNFKAVAEAWQGSKEAKQIEGVLDLAFMQTGFTWEADIQPWLGGRVTVGLVDLGNYTQPTASEGVRSPTFFVVVQTRDRAKSDAFLVNVRKELESKIKPGGYVTMTIHDGAYRDLPMVYLTSESKRGGDKPVVTDVAAYATVNDVIVVTTSADNLRKAIDAALDGKNLATSANYQTTMSALPGQNAFALYLDFNRYMQAIMDMTLGVSTQMGQAPGQLDGTPAPSIATQQAQLQKLKDTLQVIGGAGIAMTYEPTGIRFDAITQVDLSRLSEAQRKLYEASYQAASNKIYESIPALAMVVLNGNNPVGNLKPFFDPAQPDPLAGFPDMEGKSPRDTLVQLVKLVQTQVGVDLNADLIELFNGEFAFIVLPKVQTISDSPTTGFDLPFEVAVMLDSSDAARASATLDKLVQAIATQSKGAVAWQSLSGLPYSVVMLKGNKTPILTYGVVDGRLVIGSTSETLAAIQNAKQAPITGDAAFKTATGLLPASRTQTGYLNLQPLWTWIESQAKDTDASAVFNYLGHFKWISLGSSVPSDNLIREEVHIAVGK
jgi:hypothetical protein